MLRTRIPATRLLAALWLSAATGAAADEAGFADRDAALAQLYPGETVVEEGRGDLNGDGRPELVVTLSPAAPRGREQELGPWLRVVVFRTNSQGRLERWAATAVVGECRHSTLMTVERGSIFLGCTQHLGIHGGENISQHLQFAHRRGTLRLIGEETEFIRDMNGPHEAFSTTSRNLLTGQVVERPYVGRARRHVDSSRQATPLTDWEGW